MKRNHSKELKPLHKYNTMNFVLSSHPALNPQRFPRLVNSLLYLTNQFRFGLYLFLQTLQILKKTDCSNSKVLTQLSTLNLNWFQVTHNFMKIIKWDTNLNGTLQMPTQLRLIFSFTLPTIMWFH